MIINLNISHLLSTSGTRYTILLFLYEYKINVTVQYTIINLTAVVAPDFFQGLGTNSGCATESYWLWVREVIYLLDTYVFKKKSKNK